MDNERRMKGLVGKEIKSHVLGATAAWLAKVFLLLLRTTHGK